MSIFYRILIILIAIFIPFFSVLTACNIVFRVPDLYVYEFTSQEVAGEVDLGISDDELGHFFSDFMKGKEADFDLFSEYRDREQNVFSTNEQINMENARKILNWILFIDGGIAFIILVCYFLFLWKKRKYELRIAFKAGTAVFVALQAFLHITFNITSVRTFLYQWIFINPFGADDVLPLILQERFARLSMFVNSAVALVIMIILASITWRLTKPRRMFW